MVKLAGPRQVQEAFNLRFWRAGEEAAPQNAEVADFLANYVHCEQVYVITSMLPPGEGTQPIWAQVWIQQGRKMTSYGSEEEWVGYRDVELSGVYRSVAWRHLVDLQTRVRTDKRCFVYPAFLRELSQVIHQGDSRVAHQSQWVIYD